MWVWRFGEKKTDRLCACVVAVLAVLLAVAAAAEIAQPVAFDFFGMWSFARFAQTHPPILIYHYDVLRAFQLRLDAAMTATLPYAYPPTFLLMLLPFGIPPLALAWCLWTGFGLAAYLPAACSGRWREEELLLLGLAPSTVVTIVVGQNGFFSAALMIGGTRFMRTRPVLAGVLFGLLSFKPQLGLLLPIALAAGRMWRCLAVAAMTAAWYALAAGLVLGWSMWPAWVTALLAQWHSHVTDPTHTHAMLPTVSAGLRLIGFGASSAQAIQAAVFIIVAALVWICVRRSPGPRSAAVLLVGTFLATPYAFPYDMPALTFAVLLLLREVAAGNDAVRTYEVIALCAGLLIPYDFMMEWYVPIPLGTVSLAILFAVMVRRCLERCARGANRGAGANSSDRHRRRGDVTGALKAGIA